MAALSGCDSSTPVADAGDAGADLEEPAAPDEPGDEGDSAEPEPTDDGGAANDTEDAGGGDDAGDLAGDGPAEDGGDLPDAGGDEAEIPWTQVEVYVPDGYLCDIPADYIESGGDPVYISCQVESDRRSDRDPDVVPPLLKLVTWNVQYGANYAQILDALTNHPDLAGADFLLLSEVSRNDLASNPPQIHMARDLSQTLAMDYVFAVEWDRRLNSDQLGEHGVAVFSKYPLGNVTQIRHLPQHDYFGEDNTFGGRITLAADARVGGRLVRLYSSHLCTRGGDSGRAEQAAQVRADADAVPRPAAQVVAGDFNTWTCNPQLVDCTQPPSAEQAIQDYLADGWLDGTAGFTSYTHLGAGFFPQRLDWIFYRSLEAVPGTCTQEVEGSDHMPLFFSFSPP